MSPIVSVFATTGADTAVHQPRASVRMQTRQYRLLSFHFAFPSAFSYFSPSFRARPPGTVFILGFPPPTVRPSRPVSFFSKQTVLCAHSSAQGWATCFPAEHGVWSSPPFCEPRQQACCRDRAVDGRLRLGFANSPGGAAPPPFCSD